MLNRRQLLSLAIAGTAVFPAYRYLNNHEMIEPPELTGKILVDLHAHPSKNNSERDIASLLSSGVTGLAARHRGKYILTYEDALNLPGVKEIDKGLFASLTKNRSTGYFAKVQEVDSDHHILAIGCRKTLPDYPDARQTIDEIHKQGGFAILPHPHLIFPYPVLYPVVVREHQEEYIKELCGMVDEVELFNAKAVEVVPWLVDLRISNERTKKLIGLLRQQGQTHTGIAASDAVHNLSQVRKSGIYVPKEGLCIDALMSHIREKRFERFEQYLSWTSVAHGTLSSYVNR